MRTATPRAAASLIAPATTAAVSTARWKSYCATSSVFLAPRRNSATWFATSEALCPPSVNVRTVRSSDAVGPVVIDTSLRGRRGERRADGPRQGKSPSGVGRSLPRGGLPNRDETAELAPAARVE